MTELLLDAAGRRRSPATMPGLHAGRPPNGGDGGRSPTLRAASTAARPPRRDRLRGRAAHRHPAPDWVTKDIDNAEIIEAVHARHAPMGCGERLAPSVALATAPL